MNSFECTGRIIRKPELRYTSSNKAVMQLDIAINNGKDDTTFLPITIFGKQAENIDKYCNKGDLLAIEGLIKNHNWKDKEEKMHYNYTFIGSRVEFLSTKSNSTTETQTTKIEPKNEAFDNEQVFADFGDSIEISDDDIAF